MENRKIIKNLITGFICLSLLVSICLNIFQYLQIRKMSGIINDGMIAENRSVSAGVSSHEVVQDGASVGKFVREPGQDQVDELEYQLDAAEEELDFVLKQISDEADRKTELEAKKNELKKYFHIAAAPEIIIRDNVIYQYAGLFEDLNLSQEKQKKIIDILVENQMAETEFGAETNNAIPSEEKRVEFAERQKALREEAEAAQDKIKDILGNSDYEKYREYNETTGERDTVDRLVEFLNEGEKLTDEQQQRLIKASHEQLKEVYSGTGDETGNEDVEFLFPSELFEMIDAERDYEKEMSESMERQDRKKEAYLRAAESILSASQMEQFKEYFNRERDRTMLLMEVEALRSGD